MIVSLNIAATTVLLLIILTSQTVFAEDNIQEKESIEVIGITPTHGIGLPKELIPYNVQSASSTDLEASQTFDLTDFMNRNLGSVTINDAQNNPLQSDVSYRGYSLSPLLGLPQGLAVYQNGVRINEPFGDSMNWDLVPVVLILSSVLTHWGDHFLSQQRMVLPIRGKVLKLTVVRSIVLFQPLSPVVIMVNGVIT